jgi:kinesin family protein C2/C3
MLEIYNEQIRDLLCSTNEDGRVEVKLGKGQSTVDGLETRSVECEQDIFQCMQLGFTNRFTATTKMNDVSSRSHSITLINVRGEGKSSDVGSLRTNGSLYLVDLAGSERVDKSEASGERLKEAQHINKSLSALGDVMSSLQAGEKHVPFRNSKLTSILKGPLCNRGKAMMFAHVNPHTSALQEKAANNAESKQVGELNEKVTRLEREISNLKSENSRLQRQPSASAQPESSSNATSQGQLHSHQQPQLYRKLKRPPTVNRTMQRSSTTQARPTSALSQSDDRSVEQNHNSGQAGAHEGQSRPSSSSSTADASENKENEDSLSNADTDSLGVTASAEPAGAVPRRSKSNIPRPPLRKGAGSGEKQ